MWPGKRDRESIAYLKLRASISVKLDETFYRHNPPTLEDSSTLCAS